MAFGDVNTSSSSLMKMYDDDEDDYADEFGVKRVSKSFLTNCKPIASDVLIVFHGILPLGVGRRCLSGARRLGIITHSKCIPDPEREYSRKKTHPTVLYQLPQNVVLCLCSPAVMDMESFYFVKMLRMWFQRTKEVIILTSETATQFIGPYTLDEKSCSFMQALKTSYYKKDLPCEKLQLPNIVKGVPATMFTWCQIGKRPAVMFVNYTYTTSVDSLSAHPYFDLFAHLGLQDKLNMNTDFSSKVADGTLQGRNDFDKWKYSNNLYT